MSIRTEPRPGGGSLSGQILHFVGPFMLGLLLQNLYGTVDLFVVGNFASTADVSAVTIGSQVMTMTTQTSVGFATGITVLVGRYFGENNPEKLTKTCGTVLPLFGGIAIFFTLVLLVFSTPIVSIMQTPAEAISATKDYLIICVLGIPFIFAYNMMASILMGMGNTKTPFLFVAVACAINIVLDVILVRYVHMGAAGAAVATTAAQGGSALFAFLFLKKRGLGFPFSRKDIRFDKKLSIKTLKIGGPVAVQNALVSVSFLFITSIINRLGLDYSAAVGIVEKTITFLCIPAFSFGSAVATVSAQNLGAGNPKRARSAMWISALWATLPSLVFVVFCQFFPHVLVGLFTSDELVIGLSANYLRSYIVDCALISIMFCLNGFFNSCGRSWFTLAHSLATSFLVRIPLSALLTGLPNPSLYMIGWAAPISTTVSLVACLAFFYYLGHRKKVSPGDILYEAPTGT